MDSGKARFAHILFTFIAIPITICLPTHRTRHELKWYTIMVTSGGPYAGRNPMLSSVAAKTEGQIVATCTFADPKLQPATATRMYAIRPFLLCDAALRIIVMRSSVKNLYAPWNSAELLFFQDLGLLPIT